MTRRALWSLLAVLPLAAACGDDSTAGSVPTDPIGGGIEHPTGAEEVVLRVALEGGFVPAGIYFGNLPNLLIAGDGTVYTPAPVPEIYPGPLMAPFTTRPLGEDGLQAVLRAAEESGMLAPPRDYGAEILVTDVPDTVVTVTAGGATYEHRAPALGYVGDEEPTVARQDLRDFVTAVGDLATLAGPEQLGAEQPFSPSAVRLLAEAVDPATLAGTDIKPTFVDWPADSGVALAEATVCGLTAAPSALAALTEARQTTYFVEAGVTYQVYAAPVLPGDPGC